jgi:hypothetical protein
MLSLAYTDDSYDLLKLISEERGGVRYGLHGLLKNWVLYQGTTLVVP